jgi:hypothetical protein
MNSKKNVNQDIPVLNKPLSGKKESLMIMNLLLERFGHPSLIKTCSVILFSMSHHSIFPGV